MVNKFGGWLSPEFKIYLIKEFQRLKEDENQRKPLAWNLNRTCAKINYGIHTDAIKENIIPPNICAPRNVKLTHTISTKISICYGDIPTAQSCLVHE